MLLFPPPKSVLPVVEPKIEGGCCPPPPNKGLLVVEPKSPVPVAGFELPKMFEPVVFPNRFPPDALVLLAGCCCGLVLPNSPPVAPLALLVALPKSPVPPPPALLVLAFPKSPVPPPPALLVLAFPKSPPPALAFWVPTVGFDALLVVLNPAGVGLEVFPNKLDDPVLAGGFTVVEPKSPPLPVVPVVVDPNKVLPVFAELPVVALPKSEGCVG